jgi:hypothetical protein
MPSPWLGPELFLLRLRSRSRDRLLQYTLCLGDHFTTKYFGRNFVSVLGQLGQRPRGYVRPTYESRDRTSISFGIQLG